MAEGDFVRNYFRVHNARTGEKEVDTSYGGNAYDGHYGADALMAEEIVKHITMGTPLKVSVVDALEAGLTAIKIDEARKTRQVIDLTETWKKFDAHQG